MTDTATTRTHVPKKTQADVLIRCRRRCCLCYFWDQDGSQKDGQIAHINRKSSDALLENLAYLCFEHHNQYDSTAKQAKGITEDELRHARAQLHRHLNERPSYLVTVKLDCGDEDPANAVEKLTGLIKTVTHSSDDIEVVDVRKGSILVTLRLRADQVETVFQQIDTSAFEELGVVDATIDYVEDDDLSDAAHEGPVAEATAEPTAQAMPAEAEAAPEREAAEADVYDDW